MNIAKAAVNAMFGAGGKLGPILSVAQGANQYAFILDASVPMHQKRTTKAIIDQTGQSSPNQDILDSPQHVDDILGIGWAKADAKLAVRLGYAANEADLFALEMPNCDRPAPGVLCLGPASQATTQAQTAFRVAQYANLGSYLYAYGNSVSTAGLEQAMYWTGGTTTWAKTGATALTAAYEAAGGGGLSGFPVLGMALIGTTTYALRNGYQQGTDTNYYQLCSQVSPTGAWTVISHGAVTNAPTPGAVGTAGGNLIAIGSTLYTIGSGILRSSTGSMATWASAAGSPTTPVPNTSVQALIVWTDANNNLVPTILALDGIYQYSINAAAPVWSKIVDFGGDIQTNNGVAWAIFTPQIGDTISPSSGSFLLCSNGKRLWAFRWSGNGTGARIVATDIVGSSMPHGLPGYRQGRVLACAASRLFVELAIGGEDASHTGGVYRAQFDGKKWAMWGPFYDQFDANEQVRALGVSSNDDSTMRLHMAEDTVAGGTTTTQTFFAAIDSDPRFVTGYKHTGTAAYIVFAVNDRGLPSFAGTNRAMRVIGSNLGSAGATGQISAAYFSPDQSPLDASVAVDGVAGDWSTTMGAVTASLTNITWPVSGPTQAVTSPATPAGTGYAANSMQLMLKLASNGSNASCYLTSLDVFVRKHPAITYVRVFTIDVKKSAGLGTVGSVAQVMANLRNIVSSNLDCTLSFGDQIVGVVHEPYSYAGFGFEPVIVSDSGVLQGGSGGNGIEEPLPGTVKIAFATTSAS